MRSLVLGNGQLLICFDQYGRVSDFYFPYVGQENHVGAQSVHRLGVWVDGSFSWLGSGEWEIDIDYEDNTFASKITAYNPRLNARLHFCDTVYNEKNIFIRQIRIENLEDRNRTFKIFCNQQFRISETQHADTAYYDPNNSAVIHYKGRRVFMIGGSAGGKHMTNYSIGLFGAEGREGTWRDAEDGELSGNPVEHGQVDSTVQFDVPVTAGAEGTLNYWITVAETFKQARNLQIYIHRQTVEHIMRTTKGFWQAWANKTAFNFDCLPESWIRLFKRSLFIIRAHCDNHGAIIASGDGGDRDNKRDTYAYMWPRDGVYIASALDRGDYHDITRRFYKFIDDIVTDRGFVLHKYLPDRAVGSTWHPSVVAGKNQLAIQEDESALILWGLWEHYKMHRDIDFIEQIYNSLIRRVAEFLYEYHNDELSLPEPSYGLWEEKHGVSTYTASTVYGGLRAAANFADLLGKDAYAKRYRERAEEVRNGIIEHLYDREAKQFFKLIKDGDEDLQTDATLDVSSFYGAFRFEVMSSDDDRLREAYDVLDKKIISQMPGVGGVPRYEGDNYHRTRDGVPGNPWVITTLWMAQYKLREAKNGDDLKEVDGYLNWTVDRALSSGILAEQFDPDTGEPLSIAPLVWSHAEFIRTVLEYIDKLEELGVCRARYDIE